VTSSEATAAVTRELKTHLVPLEGCFDLASKDAPRLAGTLTLTFTAEPESGVTAISSAPDSTIKDQTLVPCVMARLRAGAWPVGKRPLTVTVTLRFK
jgi:hypothetical protein